MGDETPMETEYNSSEDNNQYLFLIRHGDRWDYSHKEWSKKPTSRKGDPPLSTLGHKQARETGIFLDNFLHERNIPINNIIWMSSPFVRCLQTSTSALNAFSKTQDSHDVPILPEYSVFEWDGHGGSWHKDLPPLQERIHYFPRLNISHQSMFIPELPERRDAFHERCQRVAQCLATRYPYKARQVLVVITHAAGCIAMSKTLANVPLQDITPAAPCSIYGFTRTSDTEIWTLDPHDKPGSLNGHTYHMAELGTSTIPWNHFGDGSKKFYTGPATSRFAPKLKKSISSLKSSSSVSNIPVDNDNTNNNNMINEEEELK